MAQRFEDLDGYRPAAPEGTDFDDWWAALTTREQRVETIRDLMSQGRWLRGVTSKFLAHQWQLTPHSVENIAAESSRSLRRYAMENQEARDAIRDQILHTFEVIRAKGLASPDPAGWRVAMEANLKFGAYLGFEPAKRIEVTERTADAMDEWSDAKLKRFSEGREARGALGEANGTDPDDEDDGKPRH